MSKIIKKSEIDLDNKGENIMEKIKIEKELNNVKAQYTYKLRVIKNNLEEEFNNLINWNTAEVLITDNENFYGDVHIKLYRNITKKTLDMITYEIKDLLKENRIGLYIEEYETYGSKKDELFFDEENEDIELVFFNDSLQQVCKNYLFTKMFKAIYNNQDQSICSNILLDGLYDEHYKENYYETISIEFDKDSNLFKLEEALNYINKEMYDCNVEYKIIANTLIQIEFGKQNNVLEICKLDDIATFTVDEVKRHIIVELYEDSEEDTIYLTVEGATI